MKSFILYTEWEGSIDALSDEQAGKFIKALFAYEMDGTNIFSNKLLPLFLSIKTSLDRNTDKYNNVCERNRKNGLLGGRPKAKNNPKIPNKPTGLSGNPNNLDSDSYYIYILSTWNSKNIIQHSGLTDKMARAISGRIKEGHTPEEIIQAINNYSIILADPKYYFKFHWTLADFLQRGFDKFLDLEIAKNNYLKTKTGPDQAKGSNQQVLERLEAK